MRTCERAECFLLALCAAVAMTGRGALAQGALWPAGPPGPLFKTLHQVEPRVNVLTLPAGTDTVHVISSPGSYYLSDNLLVETNTLHGISIEAEDVTLDLMGFEVKCDPGRRVPSAYGIYIHAVSYTHLRAHET